MFDDIKVGDARIIHFFKEGLAKFRLSGEVTKVTKTFATIGRLRLLGYARAEHSPEIKFRKATGLADTATEDDGYRLLLEKLEEPKS